MGKSSVVCRILMKLMSVMCLGVRVPNWVIVAISVGVFLKWANVGFHGMVELGEFLCRQLMADVLMRCGLVASVLLHEWGHIMAGCFLGYSSEMCTIGNVTGQVTVAEWLRCLLPFLPLRDSLAPHVKLFHDCRDQSKEHKCLEHKKFEFKAYHLKIIQYFGWFCSFVLCIVPPVWLHLFANPSTDEFILYIQENASIGIWICFLGATHSDMFAGTQQFHDPSNVAFYCGNFGLLMAGSLDKLKKNAIDAVALLEAMAAVSTQRGGQSGGLVSFYERLSGSLEPIRVRILPSKRESLSQKLGSRFSWMWTLSWIWDWITFPLKFWNRKFSNSSKFEPSGRLNSEIVRSPRRMDGPPKLSVPHRLFAGHTRFATSSIPSVKETHPHQWTPCRTQTYWEVDTQGNFVASQKTMGIYVTHNGDFEFWNVFDRDRTHSEIGTWLEVVLDSKQPAKCDSVMISGLIELLRTQGLWIQSFRLAYHQTIVSSFEDIFLQGKPKSNAEVPKQLPCCDVAPSFEAWKILAKFADDATASILADPRNFQPYDTLSRSDSQQRVESGSDASSRRARRSFNDTLSEVGKDNLFRKILDAVKREGTKELRKKLIEKTYKLIESLSNQLLEEFVQQSIHNFFQNDLFWAVKKFIANAKGSFGLCVLCTLDNDRVVLSAFNQPLSVGFSPSHRVILYSSESQALQINLKNKSKHFPSLFSSFKNEKSLHTENKNDDDDVPDSHIEYRLDLNESDGEVIELKLLPEDIDQTSASISSFQSLSSQGRESSVLGPQEENRIPPSGLPGIRFGSAAISNEGETLESSASPSTPLRSPSYSKNFSLLPLVTSSSPSAPEISSVEADLVTTHFPKDIANLLMGDKTVIKNSDTVIDVNQLNGHSSSTTLSDNHIVKNNECEDDNLSVKKRLLIPDKSTPVQSTSNGFLCCASSQTHSFLSLPSGVGKDENKATSSSLSSAISPDAASTFPMNEKTVPNNSIVFGCDKIIKSEKIIPIGGGMMNLNKKDSEPENKISRQHTFVLSEIPFVRISMHNRKENNCISKMELISENRIIHMTNNKYITLHDVAANGDVVGKDIKNIPQVLRKIRSDWSDETSLNRQTAERFFELIFEKAKKFSQESNHSGSTRKEVDVLITGIENSLWVGEQFAADLQNCFPQLRVVPVSANKVIGVLGNARGAISTSGFSFCRITNALTNTIVLAISQSGQTFPTLHATKILSKECPGRVFACVGMVDSKMSSAVGQQFSSTSPFCQRIFHTHAGWRSAEPSTVAVCSAHATLTELMLFIAQKFRDLSIHNFTPAEIFLSGETPVKPESKKAWLDKLKAKPLGLRLNYLDLMDLFRVRDSFIDVSVPNLIDAEKKSDIRSNLIHQGYQWGLHIIETPIAWGLSATYIFITVVFGVPIFATLFEALNFGSISLYFAHAMDAVVYCFLPLIFSFLLRIFQRRDLFARLGKRTLVIGDVPYVHQILESFVSKLFALSYSIASIDVHGANPIDHFVHRFTHRVTRGVLLAIGRPDGRLCSQTKCESWVLMALLQARTISNLSSGPEALTIGHNPHTDDAVIKTHITLPSHRPFFLCEKLLGVDDFEPLKLLASRQFVLSSSKGRNHFKDLDPMVVGMHLCYETTVQRARRLGVSMMAHGTGEISEEETENPTNRNAILNALDLDVQRLLELQSPLEELVENRFLSFERLLAFQIVFHKMAKTVAGLWPLNFDTWRSQSCLRIATTAAPVSAADLEREWLETINEPIHDITIHPRMRKPAVHHHVQ